MLAVVLFLCVTVLRLTKAVTRLRDDVAALCTALTSPVVPAQSPAPTLPPDDCPAQDRP